MSLFAKLVAEHNRGRFRGYSGGAANLLCLGSAALAGVILKEVPYPYNYTLIFLIGVFLLLLDALSFMFMKETSPDQVTKVDFNYFQYFKAIPAMFREFKPFKRMVIAFCFMVTSQVSLAYYALYAVRVFAASSSDIAMLTAITGLANIAGSVLFGILADRIGHRFVLVLSAVCGGLAGIWIIVFPSLWTVYAAFALTSLCLSGYNLSSGILIIEHIPRERLPMGISINMLVTLIVSSLITIGSSVLADRFSFVSVFWIAGISGFAGGFVLLCGRQPAEAETMKSSTLQR